MSVLTPYSNLNKVLIIVFSYLFFIDDISFTSFLITIFTAFVIIFTAIDFKNLTMSKNIKLFILGQVLIAVKVLIMGFLIVLITSIDYFILDSLLSLFLGLLIVLTL
jgi:hypothetical protein